ncbi:hypothetical protein LPJ57_005879, partial [Coemansia sp. RSA 486]
ASASLSLSLSEAMLAAAALTPALARAAVACGLDCDLGAEDALGAETLEAESIGGSSISVKAE